MDVSEHTLETLFQQLGLPHDPVSIDLFIAKHSPLPISVPLAEADFWTEGQASFIREVFIEDADWVDIVDHLDALLRH